MKRLAAALIATASIAAAPQAFAQVAGHAALGVSVTELDAVIKGVSVKKQVLGKTIYNEANERKSEPFPRDDANAAVEAARSVLDTK